MKKTKKIFVDKTYRLKRDSAPLTYMLSSHHTRRSPLLHFDEETGENRQLRYARNQKSPFMDKQDGNAIMEPIIFEDGFLNVPKNNQVLQEFLYYHPSRNYVFEEMNREKDASEEYSFMEARLEAQIAAKNLSLEQLLSIARILIGSGANKMSTAELKRDILMFAQEEPDTFMEVMEDPDLQFGDEIRQFFDEGLLKFRNKNKDVYFNIPGNKKKMLTIPFGEDPYHIVSSFLKSDDGVEVYKALIKLLKKDS